MTKLLKALVLVGFLGAMLTGCASQEPTIQDEMANDFQLETIETPAASATTSEVPSEPLPTIAPKKAKKAHKKVAKKKAGKKKSSLSKKAKSKKPYSAYY